MKEVAQKCIKLWHIDNVHRQKAHRRSEDVLEDESSMKQYEEDDGESQNNICMGFEESKGKKGISQEILEEEVNCIREEVCNIGEPNESFNQDHNKDGEATLIHYRMIGGRWNWDK